MNVTLETTIQGVLGFVMFYSMITVLTIFIGG